MRQELSVTIRYPSCLLSPACLLSQGHLLQVNCILKCLSWRQLEKRGTLNPPRFPFDCIKSNERQTVLQNPRREAPQSKCEEQDGRARLDQCFVLLPAPTGDLTCCLHFHLNMSVENCLRVFRCLSPHPCKPPEHVFVEGKSSCSFVLWILLLLFCSLIRTSVLVK